MDQKTQQTAVQEAKPPKDKEQPKAAKRPFRALPPPSIPVLRFLPTAYAKLLCMLNLGDTEVGGFGVAMPDDLLLVRDFVTVKQDATLASISFDDTSVADFFESQVVAGRKPEQFARIWLHTHPGDSAQPSGTDEGTFDRVFGRCQWAVMFILASSGKTYARLRFNVGPGGSIQVPVEMELSRVFGPSDHEAWAREYAANVRSVGWPQRGTPMGAQLAACSTADVMEQLEGLDPEERQLFIDELANRPELWDDESEVMC